MGGRIDKALFALLGVAFASFWLGFMAGRAHGAAPSTCSYQQGGTLPDRQCTPGATNPAVTQGDIRSTICKPGWTRIVRPPAYITDLEKIDSIRQYGVGSFPPASFEYDHLIPLELGGAVNDPRNLWPEYYHLAVVGHDQGAYAKDRVENALHEQVCAGTMKLRDAQLRIARDWTKVF